MLKGRLPETALGDKCRSVFARLWGGAEPGRAGRVGAVADVTGGRRIRRLASVLCLGTEATSLTPHPGFVDALVRQQTATLRGVEWKEVGAQKVLK